jgi:hypothetical protein
MPVNNTEKRLRNASLGHLIDNGDITVNSTREIVVAVMDKGRLDFDATEALKEMAIAALETYTVKWGGFRAAGGHWYLQKNYDPRPLAAALRDQTGGRY